MRVASKNTGATIAYLPLLDTAIESQTQPTGSLRIDEGSASVSAARCLGVGARSAKPVGAIVAPMTMAAQTAT